MAGKAQRVALVLDPSDREVLVAAAWLHDVGDASELVSTGFHSLDGVRPLAERGFDLRVTALVAYHSCAIVEADERGLAAELSREFRQEHSPTADAVRYRDMATGPDGQDLPVQDRLAEAMSRYGPDHAITRSLDRSAGKLYGPLTVHSDAWPHSPMLSQCKAPVGPRIRGRSVAASTGE